MKYWWIIAIAILILLALWYFFGQSKKGATVSSPGIFQGPFQSLDNGETCSKYIMSQAELDGKINLIKAEMAASPGWTAQLREKMTQSWHPCGGLSLEECMRIDAVYVLKQQGFCFPLNYR